jgi:lipoyl(octanoyl) transferase
MRWCYLGRVEYREALALQHELRDAVAEGRARNTLLLLEHPPVITLGRSANEGANVLATEAERRRHGVDLVRVGRGGDVTYHGPGQLVGYPIRRIGRAVRPHVEGMAWAIADVLGRLNVESWWHDDRPGVWTRKGKIAAVGVDARGGVAMHGFALNVYTRLEDFRMIIPCGLEAAVTSIRELRGEGGAPDLPTMGSWMAAALARRYGVDPVEIAPEELR